MSTELHRGQDAAKRPLPLVCEDCGESGEGDLSFCQHCGATLGPDPLVGRTLEGRYEVIRRLGAGAMGAVYEVKHLRLRKRFAMKIIRGAFGNEADFVARFEQEALSSSHLEHPNCIAVTDFGRTKDNRLYLVMEFLEGKPLSDLMDGPLPVGRALAITRQILLGLGHAHQAGVVHRDVKPDNVMVMAKVGGAELVKVVDFGIAKLPLGGSSDGRLTEAGVVFGTPEYMAPEQALGSADVDERADLYAVGAILWAMLTGRPLFASDNAVELLQRKLASDPPPLEAACPGVFSPELEALVARAIVRNPKERIASADAFIAAIDAVAAQPGGGLAVDVRGRGGPGPLAQTLRRVARPYANWYRGTGKTRTTWSGRLGALPRTTPGRVVLATAILMVAAVVSLASLLSAESDNPLAPLAQVKLAPKEGARKQVDSVAKVAKAPWDKKTARRLKVAQLMLERFACSAAAKDLRALSREQPRLAVARYLLGSAEICRGHADAGLAAYQMAIKLDARFKNDRRLVEDVGGLLEKRSRRTQRAALAFLEKRVGRPAVMQLVAATTSRWNLVRAGAVVALTRMGEDKRIDWFKTLSQDLKHLPCREAKRRRVVARLKALGDARVIAVLRRARDARGGFLGLRRRHGCIRRELIRAIKDLQ